MSEAARRWLVGSAAGVGRNRARCLENFGGFVEARFWLREIISEADAVRFSIRAEELGLVGKPGGRNLTGTFFSPIHGFFNRVTEWCGAGGRFVHADGA